MPRRLLPAALVAAALALALATAALPAPAADAPPPATDPTAEPAPGAGPELPRGGRTIFPGHRLVAFYGHPAARGLGTLGIGTPDQAARRLERLARRYRTRGRRVLPVFELLAVIAQRDAGADGRYRGRTSHRIIRRYLRAARRHRMLLLLDIQPGRARFADEVRALLPFLREPDVGLALDPEWHTPRSAPGRVIGSVDAGEVNRIAGTLARLVRRHDLPEKLLVVHRFTEGMIRRDERLRAPEGVELTVSVDGVGRPRDKVARYRQFTRARDGLGNGFKLFFEEDTRVMSPREVLRLRPQVDMIAYE